jgi:phosphoribosylaminoimidazole carboxylase (NCAIR synthetase)
VPAAALAAVEPVAAARPHAALHAVAQDRVREKSWLDARAGHAAPWHLADSPHALAAAARALGERLDAERGADGARGAARADVLGARYVAKPRHRRPGGPAPAFLATPDDAWAAWRALGGRPCVIEPALAIDTELTVLVARTGRGHAVVYPAAQTARDGARRRWSVCPAPVPTPVARKAQALGAFYANRLGVEGLLAVELFVLADGRVVVNELVPCPHPALDAAELACATDQYAQLVRAVCGLPLGDVALVAGAAATVPLPLACAPAARGPDLLDLIADARLTWYDEAPGGADAAAYAAGGAGASGGAHGRARDDAHRDAHQGAPGGARRGAAEPLAGHVTATGRTPDDAVERALAAAEWVHAAARHARRRCAAGGP